MRTHVHLLYIFLLTAAISGCGGKQLIPRLGPDSEEGSRQVPTTVNDPAGPIPAPTLPPELASTGTPVQASSGEKSEGISYTVVCTVREKGTPDDDGEKTDAHDDSDSVLIRTFNSVSLLHKLKDTPPESLTGLEQRLSVSLGEAREILNSNGYYAGKVRGKVVPPSSLSEPATVKVTFLPGPQYTVGKSTVIAPVPAEAPEGTKPLPRTLADAGLPEGSPAIADKVMGAVNEVRQGFLDNGYPFAVIASTRYVVDHQTRSLEAEVHVQPGDFVRMGDLERSGAPTVKEPFVQAMRNWRKGRPWNQTRVEAFQESLRQSGLFQSIVVKPGKTKDADGNQAVVTELESAPERTVGGALKYHSDFGPGLQAYWEHRNLTGNGDRLRVEMPLWMDMQELTATYRRPFFLRRDQDFIANGGFLNQDTDAYSLTSAAAAAGIERRFSRRWSGSIKGSAEGGSLKEPDKERKDYTMFGVPLGLVYNSANSLLDATKGQRVSLSVTPYTGEYEGAFSVLRSRVDAQAYIPLAKEKDFDKFVLALRGSLGMVYGADSYEIPPSARFYSGGGGSVRGYEYQSLGPRNKDKDPLGGNALAEVSVEGRWRFTPEWGIVAFVDGGTAFENAPAQSSSPFNDEMRWGAGLGLRYYTAIGPVRVDVATPLNPRDDDDSLQFYISIGQSF